MAKETKVDKVKELQKITKELFAHLEIDPQVEIKEDDEALKIDIQGENLGLLIGQYGDNLESLQLILGLLLNKKTLEWKPLNVDIGDWKKQREESIERMVDFHINSLTQERNETSLPPMNASQRRYVHLLVSEHKGLTSQSAGQEPNRYVIIRKD